MDSWAIRLYFRLPIHNTDLCTVVEDTESPSSPMAWLDLASPLALPSSVPLNLSLLLASSCWGPWSSFRCNGQSGESAGAYWTLGCHEPLLAWVGCAGERQMDKEGARDFTMVAPFILLPLCPCRDFRLLQSVADSLAVLRDSVLKTGWEMRGNLVLSWSNLTPQGEEIMWKLSKVLRVSVLCWPHEYDYLKDDFYLAALYLLFQSYYLARWFEMINMPSRSLS